MLVADDTCQESFKRRIVFYLIECIVIDANSQAVLSEFQIYYCTISYRVIIGVYDINADVPLELTGR